MKRQTEDLQVGRWLEQPSPASLVDGIEAVFFECAATQSFPSAQARDAFRERWLGRYLEHDRGHVWLAMSACGEVAGYLVGCLDDPARTIRFADIGYFEAFAESTRRYPAHLHVNLGAGWRSAGAGSRLVEAFAGDAARRGMPGVHIVTGAGARNVGFYARNGFSEVARTDWTGRELVMLGRRLQQR